MTADMTGPDSGKEPVLPTVSASQLRAMLEDMVLKDLLGPAGGPEEEVGEDRVRERYLVGMLAPRRQVIAPETQDELAAGGTDTPDEGATDVTPVQTNTLFPSSFGLSFVVDGAATALQVTARWGRYERQHSETATDRRGKPELVWKRTPIEGILSVPLQGGTIRPLQVTDEQPEVTVTGKVRAADGDWIVTLFLVNNQDEPKQRRDAAWLFQPELIVGALDGAPIFCRRERSRRIWEGMDPATRAEADAMAMLYRNHLEFATGHGVSVHATVKDGDPERAVRVETRVVPSCEVPRTDPHLSGDSALANLVLDMKELAEASDSELPAKLYALPDAYEQWIGAEEAKLSDPAERLAPHAAAVTAAVARCTDALQRIREGIALLGSNPMAAEAFRFASRAMWLQRVRSTYAKSIRKNQGRTLEEIDTPENRSWYPFQLAFVLLNLPSITDLHHPDRSHETQAIADLLWFPTGGGKTEAYLGLSAYVMALRRLQGKVEGRSGEHGVAVLMRYTLRLLTLQQFQRAAALMCACETIRRESPGKWGNVPFRIGLWVGMRATPNTTKQAREAMAESRGARGSSFSSGTPAQLTSCPWCGTAIDPGRHIKVSDGPSGRYRTVIYCGDPLGNCPFGERNSPGEGIPALVVDDEIYRNPPSLLVATVDKFAQMPWKGAVQMLFGQVNAYCPRHGFRSPEIKDTDSHPRRGDLPAVRSVPHGPLRPPDLIIQDELHLISGPLGSLVGLYETAVDELSTWVVDGERVRPKVVASTATIRRAEDQVNKLFLRRLQVFPPHGTDVADNFFSRQRGPDEEHPGRRYIGVCALGKRHPAAMIRIYAALLAATQKLYEQYDTQADPWMTLVGYFNSIRELGGTRRWVDDTVSSLLRQMDKRGLSRRRRPSVDELTSRRSGADIPKILDRLEVTFSQEADARRTAERKARGRSDEPYPFDVVLATNMISVGVDVDRLSLMVVAGQPKNTAEYIQATGRIGRVDPGLVCTLLNWARPRDLSHYEGFEHYHATFYQHVEALSVTPFAPRALDRGLSGVLVSLVRLAEEELNANDKAGALTRDSSLLAEAMEAVVRRASLVDGSTPLGDKVQQMLDSRRDAWLKEVARAQHTRLGYEERKDSLTTGLLQRPGLGRWGMFTCLNSLRDVEQTVNLIMSEGHDVESDADGTPPTSVAAPEGGQSV